MLVQAPEDHKVSIRGLSFQYMTGGRPFLAIKDLSLDVHDKEFVCIIGPSGCGKSTLLSLLAGLQNPTRGRILIDGQLIDGPRSERAMVFQGDSVFPWLTVSRNVEFGLRYRALDARERKERAGRYLELVGLSHVANRYPKELSGGMRKRVDMARAFAVQPNLLLMDEPYGSLDAMTKEQLQSEVLRIWSSEAITTCFITHDLEEAIFLADRVIVLAADPGRLWSTLPVTLPRPRAPSIKMTTEFQALRHTLSDMLTAAKRANGEVRS